MFDLIQSLRLRERRGSKPRCHILTHGPKNDVAARLTALAAGAATVSPDDRWMPDGFKDSREAQLHQAPRLVDRSIGKQLMSWWLASASQRTRTPNFDIASTCKIDGVPGLLLVEAKAHDHELLKEACGKVVRSKPSQGAAAEEPEEEPDSNHGQIGSAIDEARVGLEQMTSLPWKISRDTCYQMSNRFAWAWKLTQLGKPVVLVYLGFLRASGMKSTERPFSDSVAWERLVKEQSEQLFPSQVWGRQWGRGPKTLVPLIRSMELGNEFWA